MGFIRLTLRFNYFNIVPSYFCMMIKIHIGGNPTTNHFPLKASPFLAADNA